MGVLYIRRDEDGVGRSIRSNSDSNQNISGTTTVDPWLVVVVVAGVLIIVTLAGVMLAHYVRSRRKLGKGLFFPVEKVNPDAEVDRQQVENLERDMIIRKSLASRPTSTTTLHPQLPSNAEDRLEVEEGPEEMTSLREDWKAWEARAQSERGASHPGGVGLDRHPAFAPYLSVPERARRLPQRHGAGARRF